MIDICVCNHEAKEHLENQWGCQKCICKMYETQEFVNALRESKKKLMATSPSYRREQIYKLIDQERDAQDTKWGDQSANSILEWHNILVEEELEAAREVNDVHFAHSSKDDMIKELIQVAAVVVAWLESL